MLINLLLFEQRMLDVKPYLLIELLFDGNFDSIG